MHRADRTHKIAKSFVQFGQLVDPSFTNYMAVNLSPVDAT